MAHTCIVGEDLSEDSDGSIIRHITNKGKGWKTPNDGALVKSKCNIIRHITNKGKGWKTPMTGVW